jgi:hypothetical protein
MIADVDFVEAFLADEMNVGVVVVALTLVKAAPTTRTVNECVKRNARIGKGSFIDVGCTLYSGKMDFANAKDIFWV